MTAGLFWRTLVAGVAIFGVTSQSSLAQAARPVVADHAADGLRRHLAPTAPWSSHAAGGGAQDSEAKRSVWDGVYTDDQAKRGETQYERNCSACHGADLSGNPVEEVPPLVWDMFLIQWNNRSVKELLETVKRSMPRDNPGGMNARAYVDVIAYLLQSNKFPSGPKDLSLNPDALAQIVFELEQK